jgi:para-aminobenzoate synthetase
VSLSLLPTLVIDNYDSFTFNLVQMVAEIAGCDPIVIRNDELSWEELCALEFGSVIISPGPGTAETARDFGICRRVIEEVRSPVLGVCLGHQGICLAFGGRVERAAEVMHGRLSQVFHNGDSLFAGVPDGFAAVRYHSLVAAELPDCLERIAWTADGLTMGVRHKTRPVWGVQFHPESVCTEHGVRILRNFLCQNAGRVDAGALFREEFAGSPYAFWLDDSDAGFSYIGSGTEVIEGPGAFDRLSRELDSRRVAHDPKSPFPFQGGWVGYFGYEAKAELGSPCRHRSPFPDACFVFVDRFLAVDHANDEVWRVAPDLPADSLEFAIPRCEYLGKVAECLAAIRAGESYEICLTNQLRGPSQANPLDYYEALRRANPSSYGAFFQHPDFQVACSSPELFLKITSGGRVTSKPIKGTVARSCDPRRLASDEKSRAENLMIVDLVRNDLGRVCRTGSVRVTKLMGVESYATVHHLVSTIEGDLRPGINAIDCVRAAFPPGSMTGAPKLRTMEIIDRLETQARGIYSGCMGFVSLTGAATFNVVIRSAVFAGGAVSIGTGGAVVAQSDAACEWDELVLKADVLARLLGTRSCAQ